MKHLIVSLLAFMIFAIGCNKDTSPNEEILHPELLLSPFTNYYLAEDLPEISNHLKRASVAKTIKFFEASGTFEFQFDGECAPYINVLILGEGKASHLGRYQVLNTYCSDGVNPVSPIYGFLTAANGDEIRTQVIESGVDPEIGLYYIYTVLGGTGRFEGVSGELFLHGSIDLVNLTWTLEGEGTIFY